MKETITIIGAGNMGQAIANGLLSKKIITQSQLILTDSKTNNNKDAVKKAGIVILAIKPQIAIKVLEEIKDVMGNQLIISIMAGITLDMIQQALGKKIAVVRVMPNLAAKVGQSMSVWISSKEVTERHKKYIRIMLGAIGVQLELQEEQQINMATAISGSGPAYFFYLAELIEKAAQDLGFSQEEARLLTIQTLLGSAKLLEATTNSANELRLSVTSKGGTTEAAFDIFQKAKVSDTLKKGIIAAFERAKKINRR